MKSFLIFATILVYVCAWPVTETDEIIDRSDPKDYKNIEIVALESAVDQDGRYSYRFENDDGSRVSQTGEHIIIDDEHAIETIQGSYSYNDVNGVPISLSYTADEYGFRPIGAHLPTPPPIPVEIMRSLRFLATAKPFVDDQLYDYKPKKKVFRGPNRGRQTRLEFVSTPRSSIATELDTMLTPPKEEFLESAADFGRAAQTAQQSALDLIKESQKKIDAAVKESAEKTSKLTASATQETASSILEAIKENAKEVTNIVKAEASKINDKVAEVNQAKQRSTAVEGSRESAAGDGDGIVQEDEKTPHIELSVE